MKKHPLLVTSVAAIFFKVSLNADDVSSLSKGIQTAKLFTYVRGVMWKGVVASVRQCVQCSIGNSRN